MERNIQISIVIAVYERQEELTELLQSLTLQTHSDFEIVVVDDGSPNPLESVVHSFSKQLNIHYYYKENSGPAQSRNYGMKKANGNYFIFLDSDTIAPKNYIEIVLRELNKHYVDAFGGPDEADESFSDLQKAISFSMTSFLTTGGIRGGKRHVGKFQPRSFNMGISREAFEVTGGFGDLRVGEDPDLSMTLWEKGFETRLFPEAKVYHKRRTSLKRFARQVYQFGIARPILNQRHPGSGKLTYWFPTLFCLGDALVLLSLFVHVFIVPLRSDFLFFSFVLYVLYFSALWFHALFKTKSFLIAGMTQYVVRVQFYSYGYGFLKSWIYLNILKQKPEKAFPSHFSKS